MSVYAEARHASKVCRERARELRALRENPEATPEEIKAAQEALAEAETAYDFAQSELRDEGLQEELAEPKI